MPRPFAPTSLTGRLVAELVRIREEAAGCPAQSPAADQAAIKGGGDLARRICARAQALPGADHLRDAVRRALLAGVTLALALFGLAALMGIAAASAALGATRPASLPLVLLVVVGPNVLTLALWLAVPLLSRRVVSGAGAVLRGLWRWSAQRAADKDDSRRATGSDVMTLIAVGPVGRWLLGSVVHAAWLTFAVASLITLAVLLSVRAYELSWATTLLGPEALAAWARALSWGPALLGVPGAGELSVTDTAGPAARQAWSYWLLAAAFAYGVVPRAVALALCALLLARAQSRLGRDMRRPGFARLRERLLPDHVRIEVLDLARAVTPHPCAAAHGIDPILPPGRVHGVWLDGSAADQPPVIPGVQWAWLGGADDGDSRARVLASLDEQAVAALVIVVRATMTPDRGAERFVKAAAAATRGPTVLILADFARLEARGTPAARNRLADWQGLAQRCGAEGVLPWRGGAAAATGAAP